MPRRISYGVKASPFSWHNVKKTLSFLIVPWHNVKGSHLLRYFHKHVIPPRNEVTRSRDLLVHGTLRQHYGDAWTNSLSAIRGMTYTSSRHPSEERKWRGQGISQLKAPCINIKEVPWQLTDVIWGTTYTVKQVQHINKIPWRVASYSKNDIQGKSQRIR
jgi:hypothetical protein